MTSQEKLFLLLAAFLQGLAIVCVTSSANIFINPQFHGLTENQFGLIFLPNILLAIAGSFSADFWIRKWGFRFFFNVAVLFGFFCLLFVASTGLFYGNSALCFLLLLIGMGCLGVSFSGVIGCVNAAPRLLAPGRGEAWLNLGHGTTGLGTFCAPLLVGFFYGVGFWAAAPGLIGILFCSLFIWSFLEKGSFKQSPQAKAPVQIELKLKISKSFLAAALGAFFYGVLESHFANWWTVMAAQEKGFTLGQAGWSLTAFWLMMTLGRFFWGWRSSQERSMKPLFIFPWIWGALFWFSGNPLEFWSLMALSGASGFCASALLPFFLKGEGSGSGSEAGVLMGIFLVGFGLVAFAWPPLRQTLQLSWESVFSGASILGVGLWAAMLLRSRWSSS